MCNCRNRQPVNQTPATPAQPAPTQGTVQAPAKK